jgi:hypothetical protein
MQNNSLDQSDGRFLQIRARCPDSIKYIQSFIISGSTLHGLHLVSTDATQAVKTAKHRPRSGAHVNCRGTQEHFEAQLDAHALSCESPRSRAQPCTRITKLNLVLQLVCPTTRGPTMHFCLSNHAFDNVWKP